MNYASLWIEHGIENNSIMTLQHEEGLNYFSPPAVVVRPKSGNKLEGPFLRAPLPARRGRITGRVAIPTNVPLSKIHVTFAIVAKPSGPSEFYLLQQLYLTNFLIAV
jgi:hypothetical protein